MLCKVAGELARAASRYAVSTDRPLTRFATMLGAQRRHPFRPKGPLTRPVPFPDLCHAGNRVVGVEPCDVIVLGQELEPADRLLDLEELCLLERTCAHGRQAHQREEHQITLAVRAGLIAIGHLTLRCARARSLRPSTRAGCAAGTDRAPGRRRRWGA